MGPTALCFLAALFTLFGRNVHTMILPHGANTIVLLVACAKDMALHGAQLYGIQPMIPTHRRIYVIPLVDDNTFDYIRLFAAFGSWTLKVHVGPPIKA